MPSAPDLSRLARTAFAYVLVWSAVALFSTSQAYRIQVALGAQSLSLPELLDGELVYALLWAAFTPIVVAVGERLPFQAHKVRAALLLTLSVPLLALGRTLFGATAAMFWEGAVLNFPNVAQRIGRSFHSNIFHVLIIIAVTRLVWSWKESSRHETHAAALTARLMRARFDELHTRLQPDFLVQTLHTIGTRIHENDPSSEELIVGLSDLLRQVLELARRGRTTLGGDLDVLDLYLRFQELLSGLHIESRYELEERLLSTEVPLLMLQPFLNEAIRGARSPSMRITVRGRVEGDTVKLEVEDDAGGPVRTELARVRERVKNYLAGATFEADRRGPLHTTRIELPIAAEVATP